MTPIVDMQKYIIVFEKQIPTSNTLSKIRTKNRISSKKECFVRNYHELRVKYRLYRMQKYITQWLWIALPLILMVAPRISVANDPCKRAFCFYYNWYGTKKVDGRDIHWAHGLIKQNPNDPNDPNAPAIPGGDNISSSFYPQGGTYSSNDPKVIRRQMRQMAKSRIGIVVLTWWKGSDMGLESIPTIMEEADRAGLKVCFHIEPYPGRNALSVREDIRHLNATYGNYPAYFRIGGKPCFFVYDSYLTPADEWADVLTTHGKQSIRNTPDDAVMIGLWVKEGEETFFTQSGFDGFYTFFSAVGFSYGSTPSNWPYLQEWADQNGKLFIPCVGPGYIDTRIRPWNGATTRDRENGAYYDRMFSAAVACNPAYVGIATFNEWHEGTQIEPAIPFKCDEYTYLDYEPLKPDYYLKRTAHWLSEFEKTDNKQGQPKK